MKRIPRFLLPILFAMIALFPHQALAGGVITIGTQESPAGSGTTSGGGEYTTGQFINLYATPASGYTFDHWEIVYTNGGVYATIYDPEPYLTTDDLADVELWATAYFTHVHSLVHIPGSLPGCETPGNIEYWACSSCGRWYWDSAGTSEISSASDIYLEPNGHDWSSWSVVTPATCTTDGVSKRTCGECGAEDMQPVPATGIHSWSSWSTVTPATCTADGVSKRSCTVCGAEDTQPVPAIGHSWSSWSTHVPATCTDDGEKERTCANCGSKEVEPIPATGHTWSAWKIEKAATCKDEGKQTRTCDTCGKSESKAIPATEHTWKDVAYKAPTCTADGNAAYSVCTACGMMVNSPSAMNVFDKIPTIPSTGHDFGGWKVTKTATCTEPGVETSTCTVCGQAQTRTLPATGHDWDEGEVTVQPGEKTAGVLTHHCKNDPTHTWNEPIPATGKKEGSDSDKKDDPGDKGNSGGNVTPTPTPAPTPSPTPTPSPSPSKDPSFPIPLIIAGAVGLVALGALIALLILRNREDE